MLERHELYDQLPFYALAHPDPSFIHQLVVDAYTAQNADESSKSIAVVFAVVGLYLHVEKGYTGKEVQRAHMQLANHSRTWPKLPIPSERGEIRIEQVLEAKPGRDRDAMIERWCASIWQTWFENRPAIVAIVQKLLGID